MKIKFLFISHASVSLSNVPKIFQRFEYALFRQANGCRPTVGVTPKVTPTVTGKSLVTTVTFATTSLYLSPTALAGKRWMEIFPDRVFDLQK